MSERKHRWVGRDGDHRFVSEMHDGRFDWSVIGDVEDEMAAEILALSARESGLREVVGRMDEYVDAIQGHHQHLNDKAGRDRGRSATLNLCQLAREIAAPYLSPAKDTNAREGKDNADRG